MVNEALAARWEVVGMGLAVAFVVAGFVGYILGGKDPEDE